LAIFSFVYLYTMRVGDAESDTVPDPG
jgi:hypothetical protein